MGSDTTKLIGFLAIFGGTLALAVSAYQAYVLPSSTVPPGTDLPALVTMGWQRLVITISLAIFGILGVLAGTILYGFGQLAEEVTYIRLKEEESHKK